MSELLIQRSAPALEATGDGWTVEGLAVPYDVPHEVSDDGVSTYWEAFAHGAYSRDAAKGGRWVNLMVGHHGDEGERFLGRCVDIREERAGLVMAFRLNRAHAQAEQARAGELTGWSVSTHVYRSRSNVDYAGRRVTVREWCGLSHVAATASPQYAGAGVLVARDHEMVVEPSPTPRREALAAYVASLKGVRSA